MNNGAYYLISLMALLGILFSFGCNKSDDTTTGKLKIGILLPLTGTAASAGESAQAAANMAIQDVNKYLTSIGSDLSAEGVIKDTGTDPGTALQALQELDDAGVRFVVGPYSSTNAAAILDYANQHGIILLSPASVASSLAVADDNLFRLVPSDGNQAAAVAALFEHDSIQTVIPIVRDDVWGDGLIDDVTSLLTQQGKTVMSPIRYDPDAVNAPMLATQAAASINTAIQQIPASQVAAYLLSFGEGTDILSDAAQVPDCAQVRWYGSSAYANNASLLTDNSAPDFAMQQQFRCPVFAPDPAAADLWNPIAQQLSTQLGRSPEVYAYTTYDAVWLMSMVYRDCPNPSDPQTFKASFEQVALNYYGITGRTALDAAGDRKYASFEFWGITPDGMDYTWKAFGHFDNATGQLVIY